MKTREEQQEYQRNWVAQRRQEWLDKNGPCKKCGSSDRLEIDHIDPSTKSMNPGKLWSMSPTNPERIKELKKCQVLCFKCHKKKTKDSQYEQFCPRGHDKEIYGTENRRCKQCRKEDRRARDLARKHCG